MNVESRSGERFCTFRFLGFCSLCRQEVHVLCLWRADTIEVLEAACRSMATRLLAVSLSMCYVPEMLN